MVLEGPIADGSEGLCINISLKQLFGLLRLPRDELREPSFLSAVADPGTPTALGRWASFVVAASVLFCCSSATLLGAILPQTPQVTGLMLTCVLVVVRTFTLLCRAIFVCTWESTTSVTIRI